MKILLAPASFKGTLTATQAAEAMRRGVLRALPEAECLLFPLADGGEGTREALGRNRPHRLQRVTATGPRGAAVEAEVAYFDPALEIGSTSWPEIESALRLKTESIPQPNGEPGPRPPTALVEMAAASGLLLLAAADRDPLETTSFGTGELIAAALASGAREILVAVGGSATVDLGLGAAQALGARFRDRWGRPIEAPVTGGTVGEIAAVDLDSIHPALRESLLRVLCDVDNPLLGPAGAAAVFGPQKGATRDGVAVLERNLEHAAAVLERAVGISLRDLPRAGAAGGIAGGLHALFGATLHSGIEVVMNASGLFDALPGSALVLTGEGRLDDQTARGKVILGVARAASRCGIPVLAFAGRVAGAVGAGAERIPGLTRVIAIHEAGWSEPDLPEHYGAWQAAKDLERSVERALEGAG